MPEKLLNAAIDAAAKGKPSKERLEYIKEQVSLTLNPSLTLTLASEVSHPHPRR